MKKITLLLMILFTLKGEILHTQREWNFFYLENHNKVLMELQPWNTLSVFENKCYAVNIPQPLAPSQPSVYTQLFLFKSISEDSFEVKKFLGAEFGPNTDVYTSLTPKINKRYRTLFLFKPYSKDKYAKILKEDSIVENFDFEIFLDSNIFSRKYEDFYIFPLGFDNNGNGWMAINVDSLVQVSETSWKHVRSYYSFLAFLDYSAGSNRFYVLPFKIPTEGWGPGAIFDNQNRVWLVAKTRIFCLDTSGIYLSLDANEMITENKFSAFTNILFDSRRNVLYFLDYKWNLLIYDGNSWKYERMPIHPRDSGAFSTRVIYIPACVDSLGNFCATQSGFRYLYKRTPDGQWLMYEIEPTFSVYVMQADVEGKIFMAGFRFEPPDFYLAIFHPSKATSVAEEKPQQIELIIYNDLYLSVVFPNPTVSKVTIECFIRSDFINDLRISLFNLLGEKILDFSDFQTIYNTFSNLARIELMIPGSLSEGIYFLHLTAGKSTKFYPLIVK